MTRSKIDELSSNDNSYIVGRPEKYSLGIICHGENLSDGRINQSVCSLISLIYHFTVILFQFSAKQS